MDWRITDAVIPATFAVAGTIVLGMWLGSRPPIAFELRVPGADRPTAAAATDPSDQVAPTAGKPVPGSGKASKVAARWPWFRGDQYDGICRDPTPLARSWPPAGPPVLWTMTLGEGYAGAVIADGCAYVLDYDEHAQADTMRCLSLDDGREIWHNSYPVEVTRNHGMSRTVPAVVGDCVISIGPQCHVACWDAKSGECRWLIDMVLRYGTKVPRWYTGQCPLIDGDRLILAPAGKVLLTAIDWRTGRPIDAETGQAITDGSDRRSLETPNPHGWEMTHASVVPLEFGERRMYVYCTTDAVVGVSADDFSVLWHSRDWTTQYATAPSPVALPEGQVFLASGYDSKIGTLLLQLTPSPTGFDATPALRLPPRQFNSEQQTPILWNGHLYGIRKQGGGKIVCLDLRGTELWNSGRDRFGHGPYMIADGVLLALSDTGRLVMVEADTKGYRVLASHEVFENGVDAWGPMALAGGRLIVRDATRMTCLDLTKPPE